MKYFRQLKGEDNIEEISKKLYLEKAKQVVITSADKTKKFQTNFAYYWQENE